MTIIIAVLAFLAGGIVGMTIRRAVRRDMEQRERERAYHRGWEAGYRHKPIVGYKKQPRRKQGGRE